MPNRYIRSGPPHSGTSPRSDDYTTPSGTSKRVTTREDEVIETAQGYERASLPVANDDAQEMDYEESKTYHRDNGEGNSQPSSLGVVDQYASHEIINGEPMNQDINEEIVPELPQMVDVNDENIIIIESPTYEPNQE